VTRSVRLPELLAALLVTAAPAGAEYTWSPYLFGNDVQDLLVHDGRLWWATFDGLVIMDLEDESFEVHRRSPRGLPSDSLNAITLDADGNVWCATASRGIAIRMAVGGWDFRSTFDGLPDRSVLTLARNGDEIVAGTVQGYVSFDADGGTASSCTVIDPCVDILPSLTIQAAIAVSPEVTWYGTPSGPVRVTSDETFEVLTDGLSSEAVQAFHLQGSDLWVGTEDGAYRFDDTTDTWIVTSDITGSVNDFVEVGGVLHAVSSGSRYVYASDGAGGWTVVAGRFPTSAPPRALAVDDEGRLWVGSGGGVHVLEGDAWRKVTVPGLTSSGTSWTVAAGDDGTVFLGYQGPAAVAELRDGTWVSMVDEEGSELEPRPVQAILVDGTDVWFGHCCCTGPNCLTDRARGSAGSRSWLRIPAQNVRTIARAPDGAFFFGSAAEDPAVNGGGLYYWEPSYGADSVRVITSDGSELADDTIGALAFDDGGRLWIGYREAGLDRWDYGADPFDESDDRRLRFRESFSAGDPRDLISNEVLALAADGDRMWVGTAQGVGLYVDADLFFSWGASFLEAPFVNAITLTSDRALWAGSDAGLTRFLENDLGLFDLETYAFPDLTNDDVNGLAARGLEVLVATDRGLSIGRPITPTLPSGAQLTGALYPNPFRPDLHEGVRLAEVTVPVSGAVYDANGAKVASFVDVAAGDVLWDGSLEDDPGILAAPGIYAVVARSGNLSLTARLAVVH